MKQETWITIDILAFIGWSAMAIVNFLGIASKTTDWPWVMTDEALIFQLIMVAVCFLSLMAHLLACELKRKKKKSAG